MFDGVVSTGTDAGGCLQDSSHSTQSPFHSAADEACPECEYVQLLNGLTVSTITMMNPETGLLHFLKFSLSIMRLLCPVITIYGDARVRTRVPG